MPRSPKSAVSWRTAAFRSSLPAWTRISAASRFGAMPLLMALAEQVDKLHAICVRCGAAATRTQRLLDGEPARYDDPVIFVGGSESYEARCRTCHDVPGRPATGALAPRPAHVQS